MTCRCRTPSEHADRERTQRLASETASRRAQEAELDSLKAKLSGMSPDNTRFQVVEAKAVGKNLVLKVLYPNCASCAYEGNKVMVFQGVGLEQAILWRVIDPHFRDPKAAVKVGEAPSPIARFPASPEGWNRAVKFAAET